MKLIFFGNEKLATGIPTPQPLIKEAVTAAGFEIEQIVTGRLSELKPHQAKIAVLAAYGRIIPQKVLDEFPLGIINIHPSLLPQYRGPTPIEQAILDGVQKTGVSIMRLTAGMDEGPVYKQKTLHISGDESKAALTEKLQQLGADLLREVLPDIFTGTLKPRNQPHPNRATYSSKITKEDGILDFAKPAEILEREIRAFAGWPKSHTVLAGIDVVITSASIASHTGSPGTTEINNKQIVVYCGKDALVIHTLKPAGKKEMSAQAFIAGYGQRIRN